MDVPLSRAGVYRIRAPHGWNSYDNYRVLHYKYLAEHPFLDESRPNTIELDLREEDGVAYLYVMGECYCQRGLTLQVAIVLETRYAGNILQVRGISYNYVAWLPGQYLVLKYHNWHDNRDTYIHRAYNPLTEQEILYEELTRSQFPVFSEVLDEAEFLTRPPEK